MAFMVRRRSTAIASALGLAITLTAVFVACGDPDPNSLGASFQASPPPESAPPPPSLASCGDPSAVRPTDLRRLNRSELANTLRAALGTAVYGPLDDTLAQVGTDAIKKAPSDLQPSFDPSQLEAIDRVSKRVGALVTSSDDNLKAVAGACSTSAPIAASCVSDFVARFGRKMFRRPLSAEEVSAFADAFKAAPSGRDGVADIASAMVLAPDFLYHVELGAGQPGSATQFTLTAHEIAARVSYLLTDGPPDNALGAAADNGSLKDPAVLGAQVDRLLQGDLGRAKVKSFIHYWLTLDKFQGLPSSPSFLGAIDTTGLTGEMLRELDAYVDWVVYEKHGSYADLLTSRRSFAKTPALAKIYGHDLPTAPGAEVSTDQAHMGLLLRAPVVADSTTATHPIVRGAFMLRRIVCNDIASPSTTDLAAREAANFVPDPLKYSTGEMAAQRTSIASCMGCHSQINPFGLSLEGFDTLGRARTTETMFDMTGAKIAEHPVATAGALKIGGTETADVKSGSEMVQALAKSTGAPMCFTKQVYRYYRMQREDKDDSCQLEGMFNAMQAPGGSVLSNIKSSIVNVALDQRRLK